MRDIFDDARLEFAARYLADISKAIFAVALASKLFFEFSFPLRVMLPVLGVILFIAAFIIHPGGKK